MAIQAPAIDRTYVLDAVTELAELLPVRPPAPASKYYSLLRSKRVKECVEAMASYLNLPIKIDLQYVKPGDTSGNHFQSRDMVTTDHSGHASDSITAQVLMPSFLPLYGSEEFRNLTFTVKVSQSCTESPRVLIAILAHELSHIVLNSLWYPDKENEIKTDLTAMLLGFRDAMRDGRKLITDETPILTASNQRVTRTTTYGYLSDELFDCAHREIDRLYQNGEKAIAGLQRSIAKVRSVADRLQKLIQRFEKSLNLLDKRAVTKTHPKDGPKLVSFHDVGFLDEFKDSATAIKSGCDAIEAQHLRQYGTKGAESMAKAKQSLYASRMEGQRLASEMAENNRVIRRYLGLKDKLAVTFNWDIGNGS